MSALEVRQAWWVGEAIKDLTTWQFGVSAGLGSGKTHGADVWFHDRVIKNQGCMFSAQLWPTYQKIHDAGIPTYRKVLRSYGWREGRDFKVLKSPFPKLIYLADNPGHEVHFLSGENPESIVASEYSHASEHEAGVIIREASENLRSRVRDPKALIRQVMREGAPQGLNNFADDFDSSIQPGWSRAAYRDYVNLQGLPRRRFVVWTDDNPFIPQSYLIQLDDTYGHNPNLIKSYRYGEFCSLSEGSAYSNYFPQKHDLASPVEADPFREIILQLDFNVSPLAWVAGQLVPYNEPEYKNGVWRNARKFRYTLINEANEGNEQLDDAAVEFAEKFPVGIYRDTEISLYGDRTGHARSHKTRGTDFENFAGYLRELGYRNIKIRATTSIAPESASVEAVQRLFSKCLIQIGPACRMTKISFMRTKWKTGVRKLDKPSGETWTHHADAVKYFVYQELREFDGKSLNRIYGTNG